MDNIEKLRDARDEVEWRLAEFVAEQAPALAAEFVGACDAFIKAVRKEPGHRCQAQVVGYGSVAGTFRAALVRVEIRRQKPGARR